VEETTAAGTSGLSYDAATDQHTYVWKTEKAEEGPKLWRIGDLNKPKVECECAGLRYVDAGCEVAERAARLGIPKCPQVKLACVDSRQSRLPGARPVAVAAPRLATDEAVIPAPFGDQPL
jgi:hypothetical protein